MVFTSGIVDEGLPVGAGRPQYCSCWVPFGVLGGGVERGWLVLVGGFDTLLGPEGSDESLVSLVFLPLPVPGRESGCGGWWGCCLRSG